MKLATTAKLPKKTSAKVSDPHNPAWTEDMLGAPVSNRGRGPQAAPTKVLTSVRLDADIVEFFKSTGAVYHSRINAALCLAVERNLAVRPRVTTRKRVMASLDSTKAQRVLLVQMRVNVDFPTKVIDSLYREASKLGVTRQSVIKVWLAERLEASTSNLPLQRTRLGAAHR